MTVVRRYNPGLLGVNLMCRGMLIDPSSDVLTIARPVVRTRAGLGSGLEIVLRQNVYLNVPLYEHFVASSPYTLLGSKGQYLIRDREREEEYPVTVPLHPAFYERRTSRGIPMGKIGVMQGTYLAVFPTRVCDFWRSDPPLNCQFCTTGLNVGVSEEAEKTVADIVETARAAQREEGITFVHFNTGYYGDQALEMVQPYVKAVKKLGLLTGVQCPPDRNLQKYNQLHKLGVDHISFCFEFYSPEFFAKYCPGKAQALGQQAFFTALEYCARLWGPGRVSGEIIAGLEPLEATLKAIDYICSLRAFPTVCVFRPLENAALQDHPAPRPADLIPVFKAMYEGCMKHNIPLGIAPNLRVSLVLQPDEGRFFVPHDLAYYLYETRSGLFKLAFRPYFAVKSSLSRLALRLG